ncbi:MAG: DsrE family protein [Chloroflexi bacterium]|nr:DsrE family protein [Chloroflexota bacterium]
MLKLAIIVLADTETHADSGRVVNALETAHEFKEAGDDVRLIFDGAGTKWVAALANPEHRLHKMFMALQESVTGACAFCARAFHVEDQIQAAGFQLLSENQGHPSIRPLMGDGFQAITF